MILFKFMFFYNKKTFFFGGLSAFYGRCSVTEAWTNPRPWSIQKNVIRILPPTPKSLYIWQCSEPGHNGFCHFLIVNVLAVIFATLGPVVKTCGLDRSGYII